jgi:hypothetical protein
VTNIWSALGIPATRDITLIRRAYAEKLRAIDQDKDPDAFMALRAAFTNATRLAQQTPNTKPPILSDPPTPRPPPDPAQLRDDSRIKLLEQTFAICEAEGASQPAYTAYKQLLALGAGAATNGVSPLTLRMGLIAAKDPATPTRVVDSILQDLGLDAMTLDRHKNLSGIAELTRLCNQRLAADLWLSSLEACATQKLWTKKPRSERARRQVARYMLGLRGYVFGLPTVVLLRELDRYNQHRRFIPSLDPARMDHARRLAQKFIYRHSTRILTWIIFLCVMLFGALSALTDPGSN